MGCKEFFTLCTLSNSFLFIRTSPLFAHHLFIRLNSIEAKREKYLKGNKLTSTKNDFNLVLQLNFEWKKDGSAYFGRWQIYQIYLQNFVLEFKNCLFPGLNLYLDAKKCSSSCVLHSFEAKRKRIIISEKILCFNS